MQKGLSIELVPYVSLDQAVVGLRDRFLKPLHSVPLGQAFVGKLAISVTVDHFKIANESGIESLNRLLLGWAADFHNPQDLWFPAVMPQ